MRHLLCAVVAVMSLGPMVRAGQAPEPRWYKGNTHTHTVNSDGDSTPDDVVRWYREHGYNFLVLTDHNFLTSVDGLNALHGADEKFIVIKGEEVTELFDNKWLHINGLDVAHHVPPQGYNGHPMVNSAGGGGVPGLEEVWDAILSGGVRLYGIAVDDAHTFKDPGNPAVAGPGRGWVVVRSDKLEARALLAAMERGDFYASTGVELSDYVVTSSAMTDGEAPDIFEVPHPVHRGGRCDPERVSGEHRDVHVYWS